MEPDGETPGERTIHYDQNGKHWTVTFVRNQAATIKVE
jgi:hypothetical protein